MKAHHFFFITPMSAALPPPPAFKCLQIDIAVKVIHLAAGRQSEVSKVLYSRAAINSHLGVTENRITANTRCVDQ